MCLKQKAAHQLASRKKPALNIKELRTRGEYRRFVGKHLQMNTPIL